MERGAASSRLARHAKSPSGLNLVPANQSNNNPNTNGNNVIPLPDMVREQNHYMPIANVIQIMRRILPPQTKISDDAVETIRECVSKYISFITGEAKEHCQREHRKTIHAEDIIWAMGKLGFDEYVEPLTLFLARYRESENDKTLVRDPNLKRSADFGPLSMIPPPLPMAPLLMGPLSMVPPPLPMAPFPIAPLPMGPLSMGPYGQPFQLAPQPGIFDPVATTLMCGYDKDGLGSTSGYFTATGGFIDGSGATSGHYMDGQVATAGSYNDGSGSGTGYYRDGLDVAARSSSQASMTSYDPFAPFK